MICYAETSAVLAPIHGEPEGPAVLRVLRPARRVIASRLTLFECDRVLRRRVREGDLAERQAGPARALLAASAGQWDILDLSATVLEYGQRTFPGEPIRSLDAIHLGATLFLRRSIPDLRILTLDARVRASATCSAFPWNPARECHPTRKGRGRRQPGDVRDTGSWRGFLPLSGDLLWSSDDATAPYGVVFNACFFRRLPPIPVATFRGWEYLENGEFPLSPPKTDTPSPAS